MDKVLTRKLMSELQGGMRLTRCRKCGSMKEVLEHAKLKIRSSNNTASEAVDRIELLLTQMEELQYERAECRFCYSVVASNILNAIIA